MYDAEVMSGIKVSITKSKDVELFNTLKSVTEDIYSKYLPHTAESRRGITDFLYNIHDMILSHDSPANWFSFIRQGAFKECYSTDIPQWIIKFCSEQNNDDREKEILDAAQERGIGELFVPTYFVDFYRMDSTYLDDEYEGFNNENYSDDFYVETLRSCILQPLALVCMDVENTYDDNDGTVRFTNGDLVNDEYYDEIGIDSSRWVQQVINLYGDEMLKKLHDFVEEKGLNDLHHQNIGYQVIDGIECPVIFDWLSD